ncbi:plasmid mobilization protein [Flavobacterium frigoris]|uniref:Mobilisation protein (MobC) n=1 Tax=Flavobacterium frigoris TaxID=229204 RepID=A0A1H9RTS0_FLAFI|nr:plasmid mobilization relaxosome protein MobC [Flavobacterium frigoris]SER76260.1 mobilisation protein (MobC) [Flavobacterium frigoris]
MKSKSNNKVKVVFYLNSEDKNAIKEQCDILQITPSFFIRNAVLDNLNKPVFLKNTNNIETKIYLTTLNMIGNNLNQIAKKLNSNAKFILIDQQIVLKEIERIKEHIAEINSKI